MPQWQATRLQYAETIWQAAKKLSGLRVPQLPESIRHAAYKCYVFVRPEQLKPDWSRDRIIQALNDADVPTYSGSCSEVYLEKAFDNTPWRPAERLPNAQTLGETSLMFLVHPTLEKKHIEKTVEELGRVMGEAAN